MVARAGTVHEFGTGRDKPVPYNPRQGLRLIRDDVEGRRLWSPALGPCMNSARDEPVPYNPRQGAADSGRDVVGATLVVARAGTLGEFGT